MSFRSAVHILLQERQLDFFDVVFLKSSSKELQVLCNASYMRPNDLAYNLYVVLYKALLQNIIFYIQCDPVYTVIGDTLVTIVDTPPSGENDYIIHTRYKKLVVGAKDTDRSRMRADIAAIESFDDIMITFISDNTQVCQAVNDVCALMKKHDKNIKISIFLK